MPDDVKWLVGLSLTVVGMFVTALWHIGNRIKDVENRTTTAIKDGDDVLHGRINRVREEYVRRIDLDGHIQRLDKNVEDLRREMRENAKDAGHRLDVIIQAVAPKREG